MVSFSLSLTAMVLLGVSHLALSAQIPTYTKDDIEYWMDEEELDWDELQEDQRQFLTARGWTEEYWDCQADEESLLDWEELSEERRLLWTTRGWTEERWEGEDPCRLPMKMSTPEAFKPLLIDLKVPELDNLKMDCLEDEHQEIRIVDGYAEGHVGNEEFTASMQLTDIVRSAKNGSLAFYLHLEEGMREKKYLQEKIGDKVVDGLLKAVQSNEEIAKAGLWKEEWNRLNRDDIDWAMFLGATSSRSPMHYDSDVFNILYLVEGKKRFVMLPNDERTEGMFETWTNEDGGTGWGRYDLLDDSKPLPEHAVEVIINPGQALLVPYVCWHAVENLGPTLAYSIRVID